MRGRGCQCGEDDVDSSSGVGVYCLVRARFGQETTEMSSSMKYAASKLDLRGEENAGENGDIR
jgi:hypothetical protein